MRALSKLSHNFSLPDSYQDFVKLCTCLWRLMTRDLQIDNTDDTLQDSWIVTCRITRGLWMTCLCSCRSMTFVRLFLDLSWALHLIKDTTILRGLPWQWYLCDWCAPALSVGWILLHSCQNYIPGYLKVCHEFCTVTQWIVTKRIPLNVQH